VSLVSRARGSGGKAWVSPQHALRQLLPESSFHGRRVSAVCIGDIQIPVRVGQGIVAVERSRQDLSIDAGRRLQLRELIDGKPGQPEQLEDPGPSQAGSSGFIEDTVRARRDSSK